MLLGVIAFENGRFQQSSRSFRRGLSLLTDEEIEPYLDVSILLPIEERGRYENASIEERERYRRRFWIERDPDPTTPLNERYLEHLHRTYVADLFYSNERPPLRGWETERGKAIIKLGWPSEIDRTLSNVVGQSPNLSGWAEIWTYGDEEDAAVLLFLDEFLNGNFTIPRSVSCSHMVRFLYHTPRITTYQPGTIDIPGAFDVVSFKNGPFSSSAYLAAKIDVDSLEGSLVNRVSDQYVLRGILFDPDWKAHVHFADTLSSATLRSIREADRRWLYAAKEILLPFQEYRFSCVFSDIWGDARAIYKGETGSSKYLRDSLTVSDILLHRTPDGHPAVPLWERGGRRFLPNPGHAYYPGEKLHAYLEIYNLSRFRSRTEYDVSYMIFEHTEAADEGGWGWLGKGLKRLIGMEKEKRPSIIQTIRRSGYGATAKEPIVINIDSLEIGRYILRVRVSDRLSGEITEAIAVFSKMSGS
jgi:GWxTD domain-containing protein